MVVALSRFGQPVVKNLRQLLFAVVLDQRLDARLAQSFCRGLTIDSESNRIGSALRRRFARILVESANDDVLSPD
jgi:hypothetical protein